MKTFALILTALGLAILLASCGLIYTTSADKETQKLADEYGGVYVFDKKFRDEIMQREKERKTLKAKLREKFKVGEKELKDGGKVVYIDPSIEKELPPQTLSNGCEYVIDKYKQYYFEDIYHYPKFKKYVVEYMGEEIYEKLKGYLVVTSYYIDEEKHIVPITIEVDIPEVVTTYGLYGDEGRGFRLTQSYVRGISGDNVFYLINGKFIEYDELNKQKDIK